MLVGGGLGVRGDQGGREVYGVVQVEEEGDVREWAKDERVAYSPS